MKRHFDLEAVLQKLREGLSSPPNDGSRTLSDIYLYVIMYIYAYIYIYIYTHTCAYAYVICIYTHLCEYIYMSKVPC